MWLRWIQNYSAFAVLQPSTSWSITFVTFHSIWPRTSVTHAPPRQTNLDCVEGNSVHEQISSGVRLGTREANAQILSISSRSDAHITLVVTGWSITRAVRDRSVNDLVRTQENLNRAWVALEQSVRVEGQVVRSSVRQTSQSLHEFDATLSNMVDAELRKLVKAQGLM
jgi:hypothetical protein